MDRIASKYLHSILPPELMAEIETYLVTAYRISNARVVSDVLKAVIFNTYERSEFYKISIFDKNILIRRYNFICGECNKLFITRYTGESAIVSETHSDSCSIWPNRVYPNQTIKKIEHYYHGGEVLRIRKY